MSDQRTQEAGLLTASSSDPFAALSNDPFLNIRPRSASSASIRSSQSQVTTVENKEHDPGVVRKPLRQQQTFKIRHKLGLWDWFKGLFNREGLMKDVCDSIEVVHADEPDHTMFDHEESPFYKTVQISPKTNSTQYMTARCLFDTGCYRGNIVSRSLVERLGYGDEDFEPLSTREATGGQTVTGEQVSVDAVVRLSWHHNTSAHTYQRMRFLISSSTQCDMIVGVHSIVKHKLFNELVYATGSINVSPPNEQTVKLTQLKAKLQSDVENYDNMLSKATNDKERKKYNKKLLEKKHFLEIAELRADAANIEDEIPKKPKTAQKAAAAQAAIVVAQKRKEADDKEGEWAKEHPPRVSAPAANGSTVRQPGPQVVVRSPTLSSAGDSSAKKGLETKKGSDVKKTLGPVGSLTSQRKKT